MFSIDQEFYYTNFASKNVLIQDRILSDHVSCRFNCSKYIESLAICFHSSYIGIKQRKRADWWILRCAGSAFLDTVLQLTLSAAWTTHDELRGVT
jgi:hypothetical protein